MTKSENGKQMPPEKGLDESSERAKSPAPNGTTKSIQYPSLSKIVPIMLAVYTAMFLVSLVCGNI